jgi:hypothetical protein
MSDDLPNYYADNIKVLSGKEAFEKRPEMFKNWVKEMKDRGEYDDWKFKEEYEEWIRTEKE